MTPGTQHDWTAAPLVDLDLEGSGAQDHDDEAILEIAIVPVIAGHPETASPRRSSNSPQAVSPTAPSGAPWQPRSCCQS
jgi:hypothetical protein